MSSEIEPPLKKQKFINTNILADTIDIWIEQIKTSTKNLIPIINDELTRPMQLVKVYVGHIGNVKNISKAVACLNEKIPLKELQHLKRVKRQNIILCPTNFLNNESIQEYIENNVGELKDIFEYFQELEVPFVAPKVNKQFQDAKKYWSCNFHPNLYWEKLVSDDFFTDRELCIHKQYMEIVLEVAKWYSLNTKLKINCDIFENMNVSVVVDPNINSIITIAFDNRQFHPLQHSAMMAIDNVSKTQNGGVWITIEVTIPDKLLSYLKNKFDVRFGVNNISENIGSKEGPYLCTGYNIYMLKEPCIMCSMALVHARIKRIFFSINNDQYGALKSVAQLQNISSLNHHFEVFTGFL